MKKANISCAAIPHSPDTSRADISPRLFQGYWETADLPEAQQVDCHWQWIISAGQAITGQIYPESGDCS